MDLKLAVDDACTDIIENNNERAISGSICLSLRVESDQVVVQIIDSGQDNELIDINRPDSATLESRGSRVAGSYMIEQTMDNIDYQSSENGNTLTITKIIK
jgi:anti-sigma regulatory factor (Ser/Thr protein kinase)